MNTISQLVKTLEALKYLHGDLEVVIDDADEGNLLTLERIEIEEGSRTAGKKYLSLSSDYSHRLKPPTQSS